MSLSRYAKRRDANEAELIRALTSVGARVWQLDRPVDLLVGYRGAWHLLEVKDGAKPLSARILRPDQQAFFSTCMEMRLKAAVVVSVQEALQAIGARHG